MTNQPLHHSSDGSSASDRDPLPAKNDQRFARRRRVLKKGTIAYSARHCTTDCQLRDISEIGAKLRVEPGVTVPDTFELLVELDGLEAQCQVIWRSSDTIAVRFTAKPLTKRVKRIQVISAVVPSKKPSLRR